MDDANSAVGVGPSSCNRCWRFFFYKLPVEKNIFNIVSSI